MDHRIPEPLKALVEQLARLPGLGPKSAMRVAMTLLKWPEAETRRLGKGIHDLRDNLRLCSRCGALTETDPCNVCSDKERDDSLLCVVAEWDSMLTLEEGAFYKGRYLILGGLLHDSFLPFRDTETNLFQILCHIFYSCFFLCITRCHRNTSCIYSNLVYHSIIIVRYIYFAHIAHYIFIYYAD